LYATEPSASKLYATVPAASKFSRCRTDYFQVLRFRVKYIQINTLQKRFLPNCHATETIVSKLLRYITYSFQNILLLDLISCKYVTDIYTRHLLHRCKDLVVGGWGGGGVFWMCGSGGVGVFVRLGSSAIVAIYSIPVSSCEGPPHGTFNSN
jgi:hypothetical protein